MQNTPSTPRMQAPARPQQAQPNQPPQQGGPQPGTPEPGTPQPGTQEQFDLVAGQMLEFIYSEQGLNVVHERLQGGNPVQGIASLLGRLMTTMAQSAFMSGHPMPPKVLFQAGMEATKAIGELALQAGLPPEQEAELMEDAFFTGIQLFGQEAGEEALTQQERQAYYQLLEQVGQRKEQAQSQGGQPQEQQVEEKR